MLNKLKIILKLIKWNFLFIIKFLFMASGRSWNDFYGWMLDYQDRFVTLEQILSRKGPSDRYKGLWHWEKGDDYLKFMVRHGLKPSHTVFDLGCGYGRCAIPILKYQAKGGKYIGSEISKRRLLMTQDWIDKEKLNKKAFELVLSKDISLPFLNDNAVDVVWVMSVFNHMPDNVVERTFNALKAKVKKGGIVFAYVATENKDIARSVKFFPRPKSAMVSIAGRNGFSCEELSDWESEYDESKRSKNHLMLLCKKL